MYYLESANLHFSADTSKHSCMSFQFPLNQHIPAICHIVTIHNMFVTIYCNMLSLKLHRVLEKLISPLSLNGRIKTHQKISTSITDGHISIPTVSQGCYWYVISGVTPDTQHELELMIQLYTERFQLFINRSFLQSSCDWRSYSAAVCAVDHGVTNTQTERSVRCCLFIFHFKAFMSSLMHPFEAIHEHWMLS